MPRGRVGDLADARVDDVEARARRLHVHGVAERAADGGVEDTGSPRGDGAGDTALAKLDGGVVHREVARQAQPANGGTEGKREVRGDRDALEVGVVSVRGHEGGEPRAPAPRPIHRASRDAAEEDVLDVDGARHAAHSPHIGEGERRGGFVFHAVRDGHENFFKEEVGVRDEGDRFVHDEARPLEFRPIPRGVRELRGADFAPDLDFPRHAVQVQLAAGGEVERADVERGGSRLVDGEPSRRNDDAGNGNGCGRLQRK